MKVTILAAQATLSELIERAHRGEEIVIERGDVPVARLVPVPSLAHVARREPGTLRGLVKVPKEFFEPLPAEERAGWGLGEE